MVIMSQIVFLIQIAHVHPSRKKIPTTIKMATSICNINNNQNAKNQVKFAQITLRNNNIMFKSLRVTGGTHFLSRVGHTIE